MNTQVSLREEVIKKRKQSHQAMCVGSRVANSRTTTKRILLGPARLQKTSTQLAG